MEPNFAVAVIWGVTLCAAALSDLRSFRIANVFPAILILLFVGTHSVSGFSGALWANLLHFLLALVVGMVLFSRGWVGGGDAKLYAAAALWFNWEGAVALIFLTGVAGLLLALAFVGARMTGLRKNVSKEDQRIPYGVAIAAGAILTAAWSGWRAIFPALNL
jgi:prepilin peptidase CpaA